jgi:hypothetical protein
MLMMVLAAAAAAAQPAPPPRPLAVQARASVRILAGATITGGPPPAEAIVRETRVPAADGTKTVARLIEFP